MRDMIMGDEYIRATMLGEVLTIGHSFGKYHLAWVSYRLCEARPIALPQYCTSAAYN